MQHAFFQVLVRQIQRAFADDKNKVHMLDEPVLMVADDLFHEPAHPVADNGIAHLFADGNPYAKFLYLFFAEPIHDELMVRKRLPMAIYATEVRAVS